MSCHRYSVGDEVEVTIRGKVTDVRDSVLHRGERLSVYASTGTTHAVYPSEMPYSVSLVRPAVEEGCIYLDATGRLYYRLRDNEKWNGDPWMGVSDKLSWNENTVKRPLTKLVPEQK